MTYGSLILAVGEAPEHILWICGRNSTQNLSPEKESARSRTDIYWPLILVSLIIHCWLRSRARILSPFSGRVSQLAKLAYPWFLIVYFLLFSSVTFHWKNKKLVVFPSDIAIILTFSPASFSSALATISESSFASGRYTTFRNLTLVMVYLPVSSGAMVFKTEDVVVDGWWGGVGARGRSEANY